MNAQPTNICADPVAAVASYLDSLLTPEPERAPPHAPVTPVPAAVVPATERKRDKYFIFCVSGLRLALPLKDVGGVLDFALCAAHPAPPLILGTVDQLGRQVPVLATAELVMPGPPLAIPYQRIVVAADGRYGLACHSVEPAIEASADDVRWKTEQTRRRWLAGTLLKDRCALLDAAEISALAIA
jgi:purine-binding chemotaxis protein CheW